MLRLRKGGEDWTTETEHCYWRQIMAHVVVLTAPTNFAPLGKAAIVIVIEWSNVVSESQVSNLSYQNIISVSSSSRLNILI